MGKKGSFANPLLWLQDLFNMTRVVILHKWANVLKFNQAALTVGGEARRSICLDFTWQHFLVDGDAEKRSEHLMINI